MPALTAFCSLWVAWIVAHSSSVFKIFQCVSPTPQLPRETSHDNLIVLHLLKSKRLFPFLFCSFIWKVSKGKLRSDLSLWKMTYSLLKWHNPFALGFCDMSPFAYLEPTDADGGGGETPTAVWGGCVGLSCCATAGRGDWRIKMLCQLQCWWCVAWCSRTSWCTERPDVQWNFREHICGFLVTFLAFQCCFT